MKKCFICETRGNVMERKFNEKKAIQIVALLLKKSGGKMGLLRLTKLVYLVDREALVRWGMSLTGDRYASMPKGMVLSETYDLAKRKFVQPRLWDEYISEPDLNYEMTLIGEPYVDELSEEDLELIDEVFAKYEDKSISYLIENVHHRLPEWVDVGNSSMMIQYETVLKKSDCEHIDEFLEQMEVISYLERFSA